MAAVGLSTLSHGAGCGCKLGAAELLPIVSGLPAVQDPRLLVGLEGSITLGRLRDELGTSRRYAQALLEHLDAARLTRRLPDDRRVLRRPGGAPGER